MPPGRLESPQCIKINLLVRLGGIEPSFPVPKTGALSVELQTPFDILRVNKYNYTSNE